MEEEMKERISENLKKSIEIKQIEEEYDSLMNRDLVLRRGRNNRLVAKFIERCVFEDSDTSDSEDFGEKK